MKTAARSIISLDIGERRIGVAWADLAAPFATQLTVLEASSGLSSQIRKVINDKGVVAVVVGRPRNMSGATTKQTERTQKIVELLNLPDFVQIFWQDESLTSVQSESELDRKKGGYSKADVDALAATKILEDFIAENRSEIGKLLEQAKSDSSGNVNQLEPDTRLPNTTSNNKKKSDGKPKKRKLFKGFVALLFLALLAFIAVVGWYFWSLQPKDVDGQPQSITIEPGDSISGIASDLQDRGMIKSSLSLKLYSRLHGSSGLKAGEYRISPSQSAPDILAVLSEGKVENLSLLLPPGLRMDQIVSVLSKNGFSEQEIIPSIDRAKSNNPILKSYPDNLPLEGYLYPDTYSITSETTADELIAMFLNNFQKNIIDDKVLTAKLKKQGLDVYRATILASVVQEEVSDYPTQKKVSQVFLKRLREGMPLGSDPTFRYAAALEGKIASPELDSPYNTRLHRGLPPSPIANFNLDAIKAVADPAETDYLYFVSGDDGNTYFSKTLEEHEANVAKYCDELCKI